MLSEAQKKELRKLLILLSTEEIFSLKDTVTNKLVQTESKEENIDAILNFSESPAELLCRKKLNRAYIFQYLAKKNVCISPHASKQDLIEKVLHLLSIDVKVYNQFYNEETHSRNEETEFHCTAPESPNSEEQHFALQFATWFYSQLNSNSLCLQQTPSEPWGPQHFWTDCKLVVNIKAEHRKEEFEGADLVSKRLLSMTKHELLLFNPNLKDIGTRGKTNRHGLTMVLVCGTLHRGPECLGIFEQSFGLIRDPTLQNNWKIKFSQLSIQRRDVHETPILGEESLQALAAE